MVASALLLWVTLTQVAGAGSSHVPEELQAAIFVKVFNYDKTIRARGGRARVLILDDGNHSSEAKRLSAEFGKLGAQVATTTSAAATNKLRGASAVYVFDAAQAAAVRAGCKENGVLSLSAGDRLVAAGAVAVAVALDGGKPRILVHLARVREDGHELSSELLRLARVIR